jgi:hypothetical protein
MGTDQLDRIVDGFPTKRAAIKWTILVAIVAASTGYSAAYFQSSGKIATLEERLKLAQETKSPYHIRIAEVTNENPYRVQPTDDLVQVNLATNDVSPVILLPSGFLKGKTVSIKDKSGTSHLREIKVRAEGGTIDGLPEWSIAGSFASTGFVWDGKNWSAY